MAPPADLRSWIALLEREGELVRVAAEVDPDLEATEIVDRTVKAGGPALLFEHPKGATHPLLVNQFGTERRMCLAFGAPSLDAVAQKLADVLEMQPPEGLVDKVRGLKKLKSIADSRPQTVRRAPSQEVVLESVDAPPRAAPEAPVNVRVVLLSTGQAAGTDGIWRSANGRTPYSNPSQFVPSSCRPRTMSGPLYPGATTQRTFANIQPPAALAPSKW